MANEYTEKVLLNKLKRDVVDKLDTIKHYIESDTRFTWTDSVTDGTLQIMEDLEDLMLNWKDD